ncbi:MAG: hypothetical protein CMO34_07985 [Verrucomicrobia bacterium]|nr:hypothetical protein [Verrucomicrobiota bacterium]
MIESVKELYEEYPYPSSRQYKFDITNERLSISGVGPFNVKGEHIFVAGCGVAEACVIANTNPASRVYGIDLSETSIKAAKAIRRKYQLKNLTLQVGDFNHVQNTDAFDHVIASGVIHHVENDHLAVYNIWRLLKEGGKFAGMVYSDRRPNFIREKSQFFREEGFNAKQVIEYFEKNKHEPAYIWYDVHVKDKEEIADTWLHPRFREYSKEDMYNLLSLYFEGDVKVHINPDNPYKLNFEAYK